MPKSRIHRVKKNNSFGKRKAERKQKPVIVKPLATPYDMDRSISDYLTAPTGLSRKTSEGE